MDADISLTTVEQRSTVTTTESTTPLLKNRERARNRHASESEEAQERRLARDRARRRQHLAFETAEEQETCLSRHCAQEWAWHVALAITLPSLLLLQITAYHKQTTYILTTHVQMFCFILPPHNCTNNSMATTDKLCCPFIMQQ